MTIGYVVLGLGGIVTIWSIWDIRNYSPERMGILDRIVAVLHDAARTTQRPKTKLGILIERTSHWFGLLMGLVIMSLGLIFIFSE